MEERAVDWQGSIWQGSYGLYIGLLMYHVM